MLRLIPIVIVWAVAIVSGLVWISQYESTPSVAGVPPKSWPADACLSPSDVRPTLLMFAHPKCPCTRASLTELSKLLTRCGRMVETYVLLVSPLGVDDAWTETDLGERAKGIPGVTVVVDVDAALADAFQVKTSGETLLYDGDRKLRFHGGITSSRGHEGENVGRLAIANQLIGNRSVRQHDQVVTTPVFGCALQNHGTTD